MVKADRAMTVAWSVLLIGAALLTGRTAARRLAMVVVEGDSMMPTLRDGDRLLAWRGRRRPRVDDLVVFETPLMDGAVASWHLAPACVGQTDRMWAVKRVAALAGDVVGARPAGALGAEETVPAGHLMVLGDNPAESYDSRRMGAIPVERVFGVVLLRLASRA